MSASDQKNSYEVIIVGFGPVGATLANLLGLLNVRTLIIDKEKSAYHLPRAVHFDDEVMRIFQAAGVATTLEPMLRVNPGMRFINAEGKILLNWPRPQELTAQGWHASYRCHQPDVEAVLREGLKRFPHVSVLTQCQAQNWTQTSEGVQLTCQDLPTGETLQFQTRYLVGSDGANSMVRRLIGDEKEDFGFNERWLVVDVLLKADKPELGDFSIQHCNPARPATYVRGPGMRRRWEISVLDHEDSQEIIQEQQVWALLKPWLSKEEAILERAAVYTFNSVLAKKWQDENVFIAGDAAHLTPPFMGQGMCAGIRDAANLAWKLAYCLQKGEFSSLLSSYQTERYPHASEYIQTAVRLGGLINTSGTEDALSLALTIKDGLPSMESLTPKLGEGFFVPGSNAVGRLFIQPTLNNGKQADDEVGYRFALYGDASWLLAQEGLKLRLEQADIACLTTQDATVELDEWLKTQGVKAVLVRPDRYVFGVASNAQELNKLIEEIG